ncbi:MAG: DUF4340 domain-containing protein [Ruminococcaceae bacterium]|nr:DUF4340 domain-containing protein [Oscillospiraceae bacterium]
MAKTKKAMTKRQRSLVTAAIALLAVILVVVIILVLPEKEKEEESTSSSTSVADLIPLISYKPEEVAELKVENDKDGYTVVVYEDKTKNDDGEEEISYSMEMEELEGISVLDSANFSVLSSKMTNIKAEELITEDVSRKGEFGFDDPLATLTFKLRDGSSNTLIIGAAAPADAGYYVLYEDKIYLAQTSTCEIFLKGYRDFVAMTLTMEVDLEQYSIMFAGLKISGTLHPEEIEISYDAEATAASEYVLTSTTYKMKAGDIEKGVRSLIVDEKFKTLLNLKASEVIEANPTEAQLKEYGLDEPYSEIEFSLFADAEQKETVEYSIKISEPVDGSCYVMHDDVNVIYKMDIPEENMFKYTFNDMVNTMPLVPYITKVERMILTTPEKEYVFDIEHILDEEEKEDIIVTYEGRTLISDYFRTFYGTCIGITGDEYVNIEEMPSINSLGKPLLEITFQYINGGREDDVISIYEGPIRRAYVAYNGQLEFLSKTTKLETALENLEKVLNDQETSY